MKLNKLQKKALTLLANSPLREKFYWTGGTLLAFYYLKHRRSLDIDFFSEEKFSFKEINSWVQQFKKEAGFKKVAYQKIFDRYEFLFKNKGIFRIEFVYYNQGRKTLKKRTRFLGIYVDSLEDIAANKTMALIDRNEPKDLFDIYFLLTQKGFTPQKLLKLTRQKFGMEVSKDLFFSEVFKGLPLLEKVKPLMIKRKESEKTVLLKKIRDYFQKKSNSYLKNVLK